MSTAIWARFAASATSVKSLRKASVEGALVGAGAGGTILLMGDCCVDDRAELCMLDEVDRGSIVVGWWGLVATVEWNKWLVDWIVGFENSVMGWVRAELW